MTSQKTPLKPGSARPKRIAKPAAQRRTEILDAAQDLFVTRGFHMTSMEDILATVGIAKGTLYYHFPSKEHILRGLVQRTTAQIIDRAQAIADSDLPAEQRFLGALAAARLDNHEAKLTDQLHAPGNSEFHILSIVETVNGLTPILTAIVEEGIDEGVFHTPHPQEVVEIVLTSAGMLLDQGIFIGQADAISRRTTGLLHATELLLECAPGTLSSAEPSAPAAAPGSAAAPGPAITTEAVATTQWG